MEANFWDLQWWWYLAGFALVPRITMMVILGHYVTDGFKWHLLFAGITIWWMYPSLGLGVGSKAAFTLLSAALPRLLLGVVALMYLPNNRAFAVVACVVGLAIDLAVKTFQRSSAEKT